MVDLQVGRWRAEAAGNILLVEDDDEVAALVAGMLDELGFEVVRAATAAAALGALANNRAVDLVFSDIMMPGGMNGVELAKEIRLRRKDLPILLTSGYSEAAKQAAENQGIKILRKPYQLAELAEALRRTMAGGDGN
nr:response regulator [Rhizobium leguminosarum]